MIETICMDCEISLGFKDGDGVIGISHGLCENCADARILELERLKNDLF